MPTGLRARDTMRTAVRELRNAGVPEPEASAEVLLSELIGIRRGEIPFHRQPLTEEQARLYADWIKRRANREPVQRILGYAYFRNLVLRLNDGTLIPRPHTESAGDAPLTPPLRPQHRGRRRPPPRPLARGGRGPRTPGRPRRRGRRSRRRDGLRR